MKSCHLKFVVVIFLMGVLPRIVSAQLSIVDIPQSTQYKTLQKSNTIPKKVAPTIDMDLIQVEDEADEAAGLPPRFGYPFTVDYNLKNSGLWENLPTGDRIWRLNIEAPDAKSINLLYSDFYMPPSARLFLYNNKTGQRIGAFSSLNNKVDFKFATGLIYGTETTLEYYEPKEVAGEGRIAISTVVHGYRYIPAPKMARPYEGSGDCNVNTVCTQGDDWRDEIKAVGLMLIGGTRWCSGALYGNTNGDCTPMYVTANHCISNFDALDNPNASTMSFMWRYESPNCPNGGAGNDGPTNLTTVGATVRANNGNPGDVYQSDFAVLELTENPAAYDIYYLGWDAASTAHASTTGIHHPAGDVKKISMDNDPAAQTTYYGNTILTDGTHWRVLDWDSGTTEGGSSGSPLFNSVTHKAIGHLSGGDAACGNDEPDWYGQTLDSWENNGATNAGRRMRDWLDPGNTGITDIDGYYPPNCPVPDCNDGIQNQGETGVDCGGPNCAPCPCETPLTLRIMFDNYPEETTWTLQNNAGTIIASGGPYPSQPDESTLEIPICGELDCMTFTIFDSAGDGICCGQFGDGEYALINDLDNSTVASGAQFGNQEATPFCIDGVSLKPKVFLGGPFNGTDMNMGLNAASMIPGTSPYADGLTTTMTVISTYGIVDWVEVQLRSTVGPIYPILAKRAALLKSDGTVVDTDGFTPVTFPEAAYSGITDGNYRVAIQHRNHLGVMTNTDYMLD